MAVYRLYFVMAQMLSSGIAGCSSEHNTEVQLPNGVLCKSETHGSFLWESHSVSCTDEKGNVIGSYKSD